MYSLTRRCVNIASVAGSVFVGAEDAYSYLAGAWSEMFKNPQMPFQRVSFSRRMITAMEAHTRYSCRFTLANPTTEHIQIDLVF